MFELLCTAKDDLAQALYFARFLLKKGWHYEPWERRWTIYMQQTAFTTALVVSYSRPFVKSRGWPDFPERLLNYDQGQRQLHKRLIRMRNEVYAHSDIASRHIRPFKMPNSSFPSRIESQPTMRLTKPETEAVAQMITAMQQTLSSRIETLHRNLTK